MRLNLYKIKDGKREEWLTWCDYLMKHYEEAANTLAEENLTREVFYVFGEGNVSYAVGVHFEMEGKEKLPANMDKDINKKHMKKVHECLEPQKSKIVGYDIKI